MNGEENAFMARIWCSSLELRRNSKGMGCASDLDHLNTTSGVSSFPVVGDTATNAMVQPQISSLQNEVGGIDNAAVAKSGSQLQVMCGPLINYHGMTEEGIETFWHGSVLLVVEPGTQVPHLKYMRLGPGGETEKSTSVEGLKLYSDPIKTFWRFSLRIPLSALETTWEYTIPNMHFRSEVSTSSSRQFVVPVASQSMRLMFHSCNGFSVTADEDFWCGKANLRR